ncbi:MAG: methionine synthase I [Chloroflexi bacterium RBG_16_52_11]|nr:MAG: methionine synthase I [Chloroflexi bacterium RBG_16_52_11]
MNRFQELLASQSIILLDGAMGTMLMAAGLTSGASPEEWNVLYPDRVRSVHREYIQAGSRLILTNSFGGNRFRLKLHNLEDRVYELNRAAAANARAEADAAPYPVAVGGSMGPSGELLEPMGTMTYDQAKDAFAEQATGLAAGGVDVLWIETMSDLNEAKAAIEGARSAGNLPVAATMTFDTHGYTMMGVSPSKAIDSLGGLDLVVLGANCGNGPAEIETVIEAMHKTNPDLILVAKSNAGIPKWQNNQLSYDGTPEVMAEYALSVGSLGARLIGACCGSTPAHIRAMAVALGQAVPAG